MARRLVTVIIDDLYHESEFMIETLKKYTNVHPVTGIDDVIDELDEIESSQNSVVDVILCDVNMDKDVSPQPFQLVTDRANRELTPGFAMEKGGWLAREPDETGEGGVSQLKPYGPILALPFTRYFRNGGVIQPISNYWHDRRLVDTDFGHINGFVYVCLRLIMDQGGVMEDPSSTSFGERFSAMYGAAVNTTTATLYEEQFMLAVAQRRSQLLAHAHAVEGLEGLTLDQIAKPGEVAIWTADGRADRIYRHSLFADFAIRLAGIERQASPSRQPSAKAALDRELQSELENYPPGLNVSEISGFCGAFVDVMESRDSGTFIQRYAEARLKSNTTDPTVPAPCDPIELKSHLRRYLLLTAQLYIYASKILVQEGNKPNAHSHSAMNRALCDCLGLQFTTQKVKEFAYGKRNPKVVAKGNRFTRPFWTGTDSTGWQAFNLLRRPGIEDGFWDWDDIDREVARKVWEKIGEDSATLPHGLSGD